MSVYLPLPPPSLGRPRATRQPVARDLSQYGSGYIYIYMCVCMRVYIYIHVYIFICIYVYMHIYVCTYTCAHTPATAHLVDYI